jgi:hypothetical protein
MRTSVLGVPTSVLCVQDLRGASRQDAAARYQAKVTGDALRKRYAAVLLVT